MDFYLQIEADLNTLVQIRNGSAAPVNFLANLSMKYCSRLNLYKLELERAELSMQCMMGSQGTNAQGMYIPSCGIRCYTSMQRTKAIFL